MSEYKQKHKTRVVDEDGVADTSRSAKKLDQDPPFSIRVKKAWKNIIVKKK